LPGGFVADAVENWIERNQRIPRKIHLGYKAGSESGTKQRKMNMSRTPCIRMIPPRVRAWFNGKKLITAFVIRDELPFADKIWVQRRIMLIDAVPVASG
jgi:hypothetical protein